MMAEGWSFVRENKEYTVLIIQYLLYLYIVHFNCVIQELENYEFLTFKSYFDSEKLPWEAKYVELVSLEMQHSFVLLVL